MDLDKGFLLRDCAAEVHTNVHTETKPLKTDIYFLEQY